jgi:competence protein ComEC
VINPTPFLNDQSRWFLWWPVGMGAGIALYFSLFHEPSFAYTLILPLTCLAFIGAFICFWRRYTLSFLVCMMLLALSLGFVTAKWRTDWLSTPFLLEKVENITISGRIVDIEEQPGRRRLTLDTLAFSQAIPSLHKVRLTMPLSHPLMAMIGDHVSLNASLLPLSDPVSLKGYHFRRQAYFQGIGATGRVKGPVHVIEKKDNLLWVASARYHLTQMVRQNLSGQQGEIAAALITGDRSGISPAIRQAFTDAGLAHILAISGLHLTLVAGLVFLIFRRGLALIPLLAENYPIKKWAAIVVMITTFAYLCISGFGIPGQRAFVMVSIVMIGILLDRNPLSMRLVAIAATVILLVRPESLLSASFQLSFAAVVALIAAYEGGWGALQQWSLERGACYRLMVYGIGLVMTTLIATLATTPYTLAIFNRFTLQVIVGNFLAIPLTSIFIMPAATLSVLSLPFGGLDLAFHLLSFGLEQLISIAEMVSAWPGAAIMVPTPPDIFIPLITLGGLWICFWRNPWRWAGLVPCGLGCFSLFFQYPATIYAAGDGSVIAYRLKDTLYVSDLKRGSFFTDQWMKELGLTHKKEWLDDQIKIGPVLLARFKGPSFNPSKGMCQEKILITTGYAWRACKREQCMPDILIDRYTLKRDGSYQLWVTPNDIDIKSVRAFFGKRPWSLPWP